MRSQLPEVPEGPPLPLQGRCQQSVEPRPQVGLRPQVGPRPQGRPPRKSLGTRLQAHCPDAKDQPLRNALGNAKLLVFLDVAWLIH